MQGGWKRRFGRIAALLGVLGLLLSGANLAAARAMAGAPDAHAASGYAGQPAYAGYQDHRPGHRDMAGAKPTVLASAEHPALGPYDFDGTRCAAAGCPPVNMFPAADPGHRLAWVGASIAFVRYGVTVPAGITAMPMTPPPRRGV